jgi:hypothetical protein
MLARLVGGLLLGLLCVGPSGGPKPLCVAPRSQAGGLPQHSRAMMIPPAKCSRPRAPQKPPGAQSPPQDSAAGAFSRQP